MPEQKRWTKARVLRAYAEWRALSDHAEDVARRHRKANGWDFEGMYRLELPGWSGTGWPGTTFEWTPDDGEESDCGLPLEYLWTDKWENEMLRAQMAWQETQDGKEAEQRARAEYERLKARFEPAP